MSKRNRKRRKAELASRKRSEINLMQGTFVDANVFLDAILGESSKGLEFFKSLRGNAQKVVTSTHAIGEVVKKLHQIAREEKPEPDSDYNVEKHIQAFKGLLDITNIEIVNFSDKTYELIGKVHSEDSRIKFKDSIHVALAYETACSKFATLDKGINAATLRKFELAYADI